MRAAGHERLYCEFKVNIVRKLLARYEDRGNFEAADLKARS